MRTHKNRRTNAKSNILYKQDPANYDLIPMLHMFFESNNLSNINIRRKKLKTDAEYTDLIPMLHMFFELSTR